MGFSWCLPPYQAQNRVANALRLLERYTVGLSFVKLLHIGALLQVYTAVVELVCISRTKKENKQDI
ncbi:hypothetical protein KSX_92250 [Ktedonospora formicarum]|uniref:Uncharacterized protein n=1 Tax=Ktedonospora formicarum TaxID=2778364 RepID=A0A8J3I663_9CHLR|nr:hypothetical protein KSX_92250 [Ktedonospora formicarum]